MADGIRRLYWDACVFLSFVEDHPERASIVEAFLNDADNGLVEIFTSTVSIVEVAFAKQEKEARTLDEATDAKINQLWAAASPVKLVEYNEAIARRAKELVRQSATSPYKSVKPMDAVHLATALTIGIVEVHTYDGGLTSCGWLVPGVLIGPPVREQLSLNLSP